MSNRWYKEYINNPNESHHIVKDDGQCHGEVSSTFGHANANFSLFIKRIIKESVYKEMKNYNDLHLHSITKVSGWLPYC